MDLITAMRKEFAATKHCWRMILLIQLIGLGGALWVALGASGNLLLTIGTLSVLVPLGSFALKETAGRHQAVAEKLRRWIILQDSQDWKPTARELMETQADATWLPTLEPKPLGDYYSSKLPKGLARMAHIVEESAFYTWKQAETASKVSGTVALLGIGLAIGLLWIATQSPIAGTTPGWIATSQQAAKVFSTLLVFFASGTLATLWSSYRSLAGSAKTAFEKCDSIRANPSPTQIDIYLAVGPYDSAVAKAPPLPSAAYIIRRGRLNEAWEKHMSKGSQGA